MIKFLRKFFTCRLLGHEWIVGHSGHTGDNRMRWDFKTWKCAHCNYWMQTTKDLRKILYEDRQR